MVTINYLAVIAAAVAVIGTGMLWYGPLFGKPWMELMGFTPESMKRMKMKPGTAMTLSSFASLVMVYVLAHFAAALSAEDALSSLALAFLIWFGFIATTMVNSVIYEEKPWKLYLINLGYYFVALLVASVIIALWP